MAAAYLPSMKIRKRYACDKCHNLKSKCMRTSEDNECKRCARLGLDCVYSAPLPLGRLRGRRRPNSSSKTAPSDDTSSYIASSEVSLSLGTLSLLVTFMLANNPLGGNYTYQNSGGEEAQQNHSKWILTTSRITKVLITQKYHHYTTHSLRKFRRIMGVIIVPLPLDTIRIRETRV